jgi:hypothetical protein
VGKLRDRFVIDLCIETGWVFIAALLVLAVQWACRPVTRTRRHGWTVAAVLGVTYCWIRWGIWGLSVYVPFRYSEAMSFAAAMTLAGSAGALLSLWRRFGSLR